MLPYGNSENKIALPEFATVLMAFFRIDVILFIIFLILCELMMNTDDAMAIFVALRSPEVEVIGLTTIYGNVYTTLATRNALHLVWLMRFILFMVFCIYMSYSLYHSLAELGFVFSVLLELPSPPPLLFLSFEANCSNSSNMFVI